jgi:hypothetical protein
VHIYVVYFLQDFIAILFVLDFGVLPRTIQYIVNVYRSQARLEVGETATLRLNRDVLNTSSNIQGTDFTWGAVVDV